MAVLSALVEDMPLPPRTRDDNPTGDLSGEWAGYRDCHIKPDADTLRLARLGSHSEVFG